MGAAYREGSQDSGSLRDVHVLWKSLVPLVCDSPAPTTTNVIKMKLQIISNSKNGDALWQTVL